MMIKDRLEQIGATVSYPFVLLAIIVWAVVDLTWRGAALYVRRILVPIFTGKDP